MSFAYDHSCAPRKLAGATVLQIVPALRRDTAAGSALDVALALRRAGARALIAGEEGPLTRELSRLGGEWIALEPESGNPFKLRRNAAILENLIVAERVDIVHAFGAGAAWSALAATERLAVWLVTNLPDAPPPHQRLRAFYSSALGRGDRVIAHSAFSAGPMIDRFRIPRERVAVVPHPVDLKAYNPAAARRDRIAALRKAWRIAPDDRIVLVPARLAAAGGHMIAIEAAYTMIRGGLRGVSFVLLGDGASDRRFARALEKRADDYNLHSRVRVEDACPDLPSALAAADVVVVPAIRPPVLGRPLPEAQAMARPVIASAIGILPENMLAPPRMPDELRTGWLVPPGNPMALADAIEHVLNLDEATRDALAARARQFAEFMFAPQSVASAMIEVYAALLHGRGG